MQTLGYLLSEVIGQGGLHQEPALKAYIILLTQNDISQAPSYAEGCIIQYAILETASVS